MTDTRAQLLGLLLDKGQKALALPVGSLWQDIVDRGPAGEDRLARTLAGQFLAGEETTAAVCDALASRLSHARARDCLALQAEEEHRHAELYRRYLAKSGGKSTVGGLGKDPASEAGPSLLSPARDAILAWQGPPEAVLLAVQVIIEGEALAFQETARRFTHCRRFAVLSHTIARDEARHVAFGRVYLPVALQALTRRERVEIHSWLRGLWFACMERLPQVAPLPWASGPLARHWARAWARRRWSHWDAQLALLGISPSATQPMGADPDLAP
ncbi:ferritin-like domain-containing protein [Pelagibius sp.]|uniref:ferritin-like domain-containing protein n=1 Tax=Pelagibius sp. TaxID=1931238 RepID=UPI00260896E4|nr:ferritin-like domain-containing protein [Pelagibius sp.]